MFCVIRVNISNYDQDKSPCTHFRQVSKVGRVIWQTAVLESSKPHRFTVIHSDMVERQRVLIYASGVSYTTSSWHTSYRDFSPGPTALGPWQHTAWEWLWMIMESAHLRSGSRGETGTVLSSCLQGHALLKCATADQECRQTFNTWAFGRQSQFQPQH